MQVIDVRLKERLEREARRVRRLVETVHRSGRSEELEGGGDNTPLSETADAARIVEEREIDHHLLTWLIDRAVDLERALERIQAGTYGWCVRCEEPIHTERLEAVPETAYCLRCQKIVETEAGPAEGLRIGWKETADSYRKEAEGF